MPQESKANEPATLRGNGSSKPKGKERPNPFSELLQELGVSRDDLPSLTNGDLRQIAEVDIPTFHGWMYLNRALPEAALQKFRDYFLAFRREPE